MEKIGLWQITENGPQKIKESAVDLERDLEAWIEKDPNLLRAGLVIIGRQITLEGGRLDLLALDPLGRLAVIEIKRGELRRDTVAQAIDYASSIASLSLEELHRKANEYLSKTGNKTLQVLLDERGAGDYINEDSKDIYIFIVGTGKALGLERMVNYLADKYQLPITLVSFEVFEVEGQHRILVRELTEADDTENRQVFKPSLKTENPSLEELCKIADSSGVGEEFRNILKAAERHGIYPRPYKHSIMYTPQSNKSRMLFTVNTKPDKSGNLKIWLDPKTLAEFYPISEEDAVARLGEQKQQEMTKLQVEKLILELDDIFAGLERAANNEV
jgi:Holliday junction resolvase-like predicted endonuclease